MPLAVLHLDSLICIHYIIGWDSGTQRIGLPRNLTVQRSTHLWDIQQQLPGSLDKLCARFDPQTALFVADGVNELFNQATFAH